MFSIRTTLHFQHVAEITFSQEIASWSKRKQKQEQNHAPLSHRGPGT